MTSKNIYSEYNSLFDENDIVILSNCYHGNIKRNEEVYEFLQLMIQNFFACQLNYYVSTNIIHSFKFNYREIEIENEEDHAIVMNRIKNFYNKFFFVQIEEKKRFQRIFKAMISQKVKIKEISLILSHMMCT